MSVLDGYIAWACEPPPPGLLRFMREDTGQRWTGYARDVHPLFEKKYVWWMRSGIDRRSS